MYVFIFQIFKSEIYFPSVTFEKVIDGNLTTDSTSIYRYIVATNTNLAGNAKPHHNRYSLSHTSSSLKLTIECELYCYSLDIALSCFASFIFLNENCYILIQILLKFVGNGPNNKKSSLVQIIAWRRSGNKPLSETNNG